MPLAATGTRRKKALVVISDGNDTDSEITIGELRQVIRESEVMVYAIGIDGLGRVVGRAADAAVPGRVDSVAVAAASAGASVAPCAGTRRDGWRQRRSAADDHG